MTKAQLVADLKNMIGPSVEVDDAGLTRWLNESYMMMVDEIHRANPDFFAKSSTASTIEDQQEYSLPTSLDKIISVNINYGGGWQRATPLENIGDIPIHALGTTSQQGFSTSEPRYYIFGDYVGFMPIPTATTASYIKIWYTYQPDEMSDDGDTPDIPSRYHHIIKYNAYANYLDQDDEHVAAERMRQRSDLLTFRMIEQISEREVDQPKSVQIVTNQDMYSSDEWGI